MDSTAKEFELSIVGYDDSDLFSSEELDYFKRKLLSKKNEILIHARETLGSGKLNLDTNEMKDEVDHASMSIEHDITFRLLDRSRKLLSEIEYALNKMEMGDYGYCEGTGDPIPKKRLELAPWVRHSVEHKSRLEVRKKLIKRASREEAYSANG